MNPSPLGSALDLLAHELNAYFQRISQRSKDTVILAPIVNPDGTLPIEIEDHLVLSVINLQQDAHFKNLPPPRQPPSRNATVNLNVYILFAATFRDYQSGLAAISSVIAFLQSKPVFDSQNSPEMDPAIDRLMIDWVNLDYSDTSHIWSAIGARYRPSVVYMMRMAPNATQET